MSIELTLNAEKEGNLASLISHPNKNNLMARTIQFWRNTEICRLEQSSRFPNKALAASHTVDDDTLMRCENIDSLATHG